MDRIIIRALIKDNQSFLFSLTFSLLTRGSSTSRGRKPFMLISHSDKLLFNYQGTSGFPGEKGDDGPRGEDVSITLCLVLYFYCFDL
jgi:hypothetical protein